MIVNRKLLIILLGLVLLVIGLLVGTPFEFLNVMADSVATFLIILLFLLLFIFLFKKNKQLENVFFKWTTCSILTIIAFPYFLIGIWPSFLTWSNYHPLWQDLLIYTNDKNEKVISQLRETSGSIYDYRDRKIIADYGQFRISLNCNTKKLKGVWTEFDKRNNKSKLINFDDGPK